MSIAVLVAMWAVPAYADLVEGQRNTARIYRTFFEQAPNDWSIDRLLDTIALEFTGLWQFAFFRDRFIVPEAPKHYAQARLLTLIVLALLVVGWRRARRREDDFIAALCPLTALSLLAATYSLTQLRGDAAPHHTAWISVIGFLAALGVIGGVFPPPTPHAGPRRPVFRLVGVTATYAALSFAWPIRIVPSIHANAEVGRLAEAVIALRAQARADGVRITSGRGAGKLQRKTSPKFVSSLDRRLHGPFSALSDLPIRAFPSQCALRG